MRITCDCRNVLIANCHLIGDVWMPSGLGHEVTMLEGDRTSGLTGVGGRQHHSLECRRCGRKVSMRAERLHATLDRLQAAGLDSITLRGLQSL